MKDLHKKIHPLADPDAVLILIEFERGGKKQTYKSCINTMTGDRMTWFNNDPPFINTDMFVINNMVSKLEKNPEVKIITKLSNKKKL